MPTIGRGCPSHQQVDHRKETIQHSDRHTQTHDMPSIMPLQTSKEGESAEKRLPYFELIDKQQANHCLRDPSSPCSTCRAQSQHEDKEGIEQHVEAQAHTTNIEGNLTPSSRIMDTCESGREKNKRKSRCNNTQVLHCLQSNRLLQFIQSNNRVRQTEKKHTPTESDQQRKCQVVRSVSTGIRHVACANTLPNTHLRTYLI